MTTEAGRPSARELVRLDDVAKSYGLKEVLSVDELTLFDGDRVLLSGPNGSAKSTLLRVIAGVTQADRGTVRRDSEPWQRVGYLPQNGGLYPDLSLRENLRLRAQIHGLGEGEGTTEEVVRSLGLDGFWRKRCGDLSGGYQRLAALAAALIVNPRCLLLDEPFAAMDDFNRKLIIDLLGGFVISRPLTIVVAPAVEDLGFVNRHLEMRDGRLI